MDANWADPYDSGNHQSVVIRGNFGVSGDTLKRGKMCGLQAKTMQFPGPWVEMRLLPVSRSSEVSKLWDGRLNDQPVAKQHLYGLAAGFEEFQFDFICWLEHTGTHVVE